MVLLTVGTSTHSNAVRRLALGRINVFAVQFRRGRLTNGRTRHREDTHFTVRNIIQRVMVMHRQLPRVYKASHAHCVRTFQRSVVPGAVHHVRRTLVANGAHRVYSSDTWVNRTRDVTIDNLLLTRQLHNLRMHKLMRSRVPRGMIIISDNSLLNMRLQVLAARISRVPHRVRVTLLANHVVRLHRHRFSFQVPVDAISLTILQTRVNVSTVHRATHRIGHLLIANRLVVNSDDLGVITRSVRFVTLLGRYRALAVHPFANFSLMQDIRVSIQLLHAHSRISNFVTRFPRLQVEVVQRYMDHFLRPLVCIKVLRSRTVGFANLVANYSARVLRNVAFVVNGLVTDQVVQGFDNGLVVRRAPLVKGSKFGSLITALLPREEDGDCVRSVSLELEASPTLSNS